MRVQVCGSLFGPLLDFIPFLPLDLGSKTRVGSGCVLLLHQLGVVLSLLDLRDRCVGLAGITRFWSGRQAPEGKREQQSFGIGSN